MSIGTSKSHLSVILILIFHRDSKLDKENDTVEENLDNLEKKVEAMLKLITSKESLDKMPPGIRILAQYVADCTKSVLKDEKLVSTFIGSFIILRFMNPAIFTPEQVPGLLPKGRAPTPQTRRNLTLISKIIQVRKSVILLFSAVVQLRLMYHRTWPITKSSKNSS